MESQRFAPWSDTKVLAERIDSLSLASIADMRKLPLIQFPADDHPKAVEFAMIVRNEFTKRLKSELLLLSPTANSAAVRLKFYTVLRALRSEIVWMAENGDGWLEGQLEHIFKDPDEFKGVYQWTDRYLDVMLISIGF